MEGETKRPIYSKNNTSVDPRELSVNTLSISPNQRDLSLKFTQSSPHISGLNLLTKTTTHSGHGTHEEISTTIRQPSYKDVHLDNVEELLRPLDPGALTHEGSVNIDNRTERPLKISSLKPVSATSSHNTPTSAITNASSKLDIYSTRVSFDTVNIQFYGDSDLADYDFDNDSKHQTKKAREVDLSGGWGPEARVRDMSPSGTGKSTRGRERALSPTRHDRNSSPHARALSPAERSLSPSFIRSPTRGRSDRDEERIYPTTPIITHDACTLTTTHRDFDKLYSGKLEGKKVKLRRRSIMAYISGRQHTWVALDWCCNRLLEDGDSLIVIAAISPSSSAPGRRSSVGSTTLRRTFTNATSDDYIRKSPEYAKIVTENIMKYLLAILNPNKIIKITIELGVGHTKDVLKDMYSLYSPYMVVTSAKPTRAVSTKSWVTSRITDRLVKNFPVPVIVVPAMNMGMFEMRLFESLNKRNELTHKDLIDIHDDDSHLFHNGDYTHHHTDIRDKFGLSNLIDSDDESKDDNFADNELDHSDISSIDSVDSLTSEKSNTAASILEIRKATYDANVKLYKELSKIKKRPVDKDTFKDTLDAISTAGYSVGIKLADTVKLGGKGASLVRTLTGAPDASFGKKKSMLLDDEPEPKALSPTRRTLSHSYSARPGDVSIPYINIEPGSRSRSPPPSNAFRGVSGAPRSSTSLKFEDDLPKLKHTGSSGIDSTLSDHKLAKTRSTPQLYTSKSNSSIEKGKKGGIFRKMFGGKNW